MSRNNTAQVAALRKYRKDNGLCPGCGLTLQNKQYAKCKECREKNRKHVEIFRERKKKDGETEEEEFSDYDE